MKQIKAWVIECTTPGAYFNGRKVYSRKHFAEQRVAKWKNLRPNYEFKILELNLIFSEYKEE